MSPETARLLLLIEEQLTWGSADNWQTRDFEKLQTLIYDRTGVSLSTSTLRRVWGHVNYEHMPSMSTLDALAVFAGFEGWRPFVILTALQPDAPVPTPAPSIQPGSKRRTALYALSFAAAAIVTMLIVFLFPKRRENNPGIAFTLQARRITSSIPNSVVFTYDATKGSADSVFIQQSWDVRTRVSVRKTGHTFTSQYYEPGFFHAKLYADTQLIKEDTVMIPTSGWMGYVRQFPIPLYLKSSEFQAADKMELSEQAYEKKGVYTQTPLPFTIFSNVGNIARVPVNDFHFHAEVRNNYKSGTGVCQTSYIGLLTDGEPIIIPLCQPGCISDLRLIVGSAGMISGKTVDLSGFGTDMSSWVSVDCQSTPAGIEFVVNGKKAFTSTVPKTTNKILGFLFMFRGSGGVRNIELLNGNKSVYTAFRYR